MIISTILATNCTPQTIVIGRRGTYDTLQIAFDLSFLIENYGSGTAVLAVKRSQDASAYPAVVTQEDNTLTWTITETDTYYVGSGECQLMWYVDGGLAKSIIYPMVVMRDILSTAEEPPDGYENWIESLTALGASTQQNAQNAAQSASDAETAQGLAEAAQDAAEDARDDAQTAKTSAEANALKAEGYAVGKQNGVDVESGSPYYEDNAEYMRDAAGQFAAMAATSEGEAAAWATGSYDGTPEHPVPTSAPQHNNSAKYWAEQAASATGAVQSVNGKTGAVVLSAADVGAKPDSYTAPVSSVNNKTGAVALTASDVGAGTYSKPSGGIPKTDLASDVQTSLGKADTALQTAPVSSVAGKTGAVTLDAGDVGFDDSVTYQSGTVGAALTSQLNAIEQKETKTTYTTLSGTTVTKTGEDHVMYLCGELATLSFTAPVSGITAIRFTSGTTPTVVTLTGITMPDDWPTTLDASTTYEINVLNGFGVWQSWT